VFDLRWFLTEKSDQKIMYARFDSGQRWGAKGLVWAPANGIGKNMPLIRVSLGFMEMKDTELDDFATKG
jgi:hypothetical protein